MWRLLVVLFGLALLLAASPSQALARGTCLVRDDYGRGVGEVTRSSINGKVWNVEGKQVGHFGRTDESSLVFGEGRGSTRGVVTRASRTRFVATVNARVRGRAILWDGTWVLQKRTAIGWRTKGTVSARASGWSAGAALLILLWR